MSLEFVLVNQQKKIYRIFREPTENDFFIQEHALDHSGDIFIVKEAPVIPVDVDHVYLLYEGDIVKKTFKYIGTNIIDEDGTSVSKAKYVEVLNDSHLDKVEMQISDLRSTIESYNNIQITTIGTLSQAYENATGDGTRYKVPFTDSAGNWTDGTITLDTGTYEITIIPKLTNVPESSNNFYVAMDMTSTDPKGSSAVTEEIWKDQDKLVGTTGDNNKTAIPYFIVLTEETDIEFFFKVINGGADVVGIDEKTRVLIKKIA